MNATAAATLDTLVCPSCRSDLDRSNGAVRCGGCGSTFALAAGTPILLPASGAPGLPGEVRWSTGLRGSVPPALVRLGDRYRRFLRPALTRKHATRDQIVEFVASVDGPVLNIGSGTKRYGPTVVNLDIAPMDGVDVVGVAEALPFADGSFSGCILQAVLEHVADAEATLAEARRVLVPGGRLMVEIPFIQGFHGSSGDYRRFTEMGLRTELSRAGFEVEASGVAVGPASAMTWVLAEFLALLLSGRSERAYRYARLLTSFVALPLKYADVWLDRHPMAHVIASGVWVRGRRTPD
jgi:SAM-dependent methyltransferase